MIFEHPSWLWLSLFIPVPWLIWRGRGYFGHTAPWIGGSGGLVRVLHLVPILFVSAAFASLFIALAQPQHPYTLPDQTIKARDIVIAVDKSGSMATQFDGTVPPTETGKTILDKPLPPLPTPTALGEDDGPSYYSGKPGNRRIDAAQAASLNFVRDRFKLDNNDRIGVLVFDTRPYWAWPLTPDLKIIYRNVQIDVTTPGGGTNFGEEKPGPIDAAVDQFNELGQSTTRVLIMVTDGEDNLSNSAMSRLEALLKANGVRLYVIGVGPELAHNQVDIIRLSNSVGGRVFRVENAGDMNLCFETINKLEQSPVRVPGAKRKTELFWYFAGASLIFLLLGAATEALFHKQ
jgi:hypothetical protein